MKLSEINENWKTDSPINPLDVANASLETPKLHSKYLTLLSNSKLLLRKSESEYLTLKSIKAKYFRGEMTAEELKENGWIQFQKKILKSEVEGYINADKDILKQGTKVEYLRTMVYTLESILKSIGSRSFDIRNYIEYIKYTQGEY